VKEVVVIKEDNPDNRLEAEAAKKEVAEVSIRKAELHSKYCSGIAFEK
jgi:hypothetical protein